MGTPISPVDRSEHETLMRRVSALESTVRPGSLQKAQRSEPLEPVQRFHEFAARSESEDTQRSEASQPEQTLGERYCPDEYTRYHPMVNKVADAIQTAGGDEVAMAQAAIRVCASQPVLPGELVEAVRRFVSNTRSLGFSLSPDARALERALPSLPDPLPTVESVERAYLERLIAQFKQSADEMWDQVRAPDNQNELYSARAYTHAVAVLRSIHKGEV